MDKKRKEAEKILDANLYGNKKEAIDIISIIPNIDQLTQACILGKWFFGTIDGILLLCDSILKGCGDFGYLYVFETRSTPLDDVLDPMLVQQIDESLNVYQRQVYNTKPNKYGPIILSQQEPFHPWFSMLCHMFSRILSMKMFLDIRTSWKWASCELFLCPWSYFQNYTLIPLRFADIRCKETIASMIHNRAWLSMKYMPKTKTCVATAFRYNDVIQHFFDKFGKKWFCILFPVMIMLRSIKISREQKEDPVSKRIYMQFFRDFLSHSDNLCKKQYSTTNQKFTIDINHILQKLDKIYSDIIQKNMLSKSFYSTMLKIIQKHLK